METHTRRKRYSGKYPKSYEEKYKELNPLEYKETIKKVISKGNTPAGMHIPIMVKEIIDFLAIKPGETGFDATLGYGGHTNAMLQELNHTGHIYACDVDKEELSKTKERLISLGYTKEDITIMNCNFRDIDLALNENVKCDFLLADLGISSMQIDNPMRGFSYKNDGPLDLRLNQDDGIPASILLMNLNRVEIENILEINSDEPYAKEIAGEIVKAKSLGVIDTTKKLQMIIKEALYTLLSKKMSKTMINEEIKTSSKRVFQALRIEVNHELEALNEFLTKLPSIMKPKGRIAILTFHSGEDRLVKKAFKEYYNQNIFSYINDEVIRASSEEIYNNQRAKSAKLRIAIYGGNNAY